MLHQGFHDLSQVFSPVRNWPFWIGPESPFHHRSPNFFWDQSLGPYLGHVGVVLRYLPLVYCSFTIIYGRYGMNHHHFWWVIHHHSHGPAHFRNPYDSNQPHEWVVWCRRWAWFFVREKNDPPKMSHCKMIWEAEMLNQRWSTLGLSCKWWLDGPNITVIYSKFGFSSYFELWNW